MPGWDTVAVAVPGFVTVIRGLGEAGLAVVSVPAAETGTATSWTPMSEARDPGPDKAWLVLACDLPFLDAAR